MVGKGMEVGGVIRVGKDRNGGCGSDGGGAWGVLVKCKKGKLELLLVLGMGNIIS